VEKGNEYPTLSRAQLPHALTSAATPRSHERSYPTLSRAQLRLDLFTDIATIYE
jgi:hypothetical protein